MGYSAYYPTLASQRDGGGGVWFISDLYFSSNILLAEFHSTLNSFSVLGQERILMTSFKGHIHRKLARQGEGKWGRACLGHNSSPPGAAEFTSFGSADRNPRSTQGLATHCQVCASYFYFMGSCKKAPGVWFLEHILLSMQQNER